MTRGVLILAGTVLLGSGALLTGRQGYVRAKGLVAEHLIADAFHRHLGDGRAHRPWSGADTHPIARLEVERLGVRRYVLAGASGSSLAFGPGHVHGTASPNGPGNCVLAGHRDTWFAFLHQLRAGDVLRLLTRRVEQVYVVTEIRIVQETDLEVLDPGREDRLTLVTCFPFDGPVGSPWRYIVSSRRATEAGGLRPGSR